MVVVVVAVHPGVVTSPLLRGLGMTKGWDTAEASAQTAIYLATCTYVTAVLSLRLSLPPHPRVLLGRLLHALQPDLSACLPVYLSQRPRSLV